MNIDKLCEMKRTGEYLRQGKLFYTSQSAYLYDTGTGKVVKLDSASQKCFESLFNPLVTEEAFRSLLNTLPDAAAICSFLDRENLLCNPKITKFVDLSKFYDQENFQCDQLIIELTGNCNLRCKYCIYNDFYEGNRAFNTSSIDFGTAKKAIDYVYAHSGQEKLAITFYGGEPLLNFKVMKECIEYCLNNLHHKHLSFSFTTNLTLMTEEIADYVAQVPNMSILLSLDGPENIHNRSRVKRNGEGSFQDAFTGLKYLSEAVTKHKKAAIMFNAVLMPPYTKERFDEINDFFKNLDFLPENVEIRATYPSTGSIPDSYFEEMHLLGEDTLEETTWTLWAKEKFCEDRLFSDMKNLYSGLMRNGLTRIHNRILVEKPMDATFFNGCCIPGGRRLYVCTDGSYKVCERIGNAPSIGHVDTGIDTEAIKKYYIEDYEEKSLPSCSNCWAVNLCDLCYSHCYDENGINMTEKEQACPQVRKRYVEWLQDYHELLENDPETIKKISEVQIS